MSAALLSFAEGQPAAAIADLDAALRLSPRAANAYFHPRAPAAADRAVRVERWPTR